MPRISVAFISIGAVCGLAGMVWGGWMGASGDHLMMPVHAHLNLLGWVSLAIMGAVYALPGARPAGPLAWANFALSSGGAILMVPMLAWLLEGHDQIGPWMLVPEALVFLGLALFLANVLRSGVGRAA
ncbi:MAG: hypothetical protein ACYC8V_12140 [Caulobacteraceae bacterium]